MSINKRILSVALAFTIIFVQMAVISFASAESSDSVDISSLQETVDESTYKIYSSKYSKCKNTESATVTLNNVIGTYEYSDIFSTEINIPNDSLLELCLNFRSNGTQDVVLSMTIDGKVPFSEALRLTFPILWKNSDNNWKKEAGNQFTPEQIVYDGDVEDYARDYSGKEENNYIFFIPSGNHTVTFTVLQGEFTLNEAVFKTPVKSSEYSEPKKSDGFDKVIVIEGEDADIKNSRSLVPMSDNASALVHPYDATVTKLNYIGNSNWSDPGSAVTWNFNVEKSGYYTVGFNFRQSQILGGVAYRSLLIDGSSPFAEAEKIKFKYGSKWQYKDFADSEDNPYKIYLEKGKHTLSMVVTPGELASIYSDMQDVTAKMGNLYVDITKVVGETVDIYRSYELFKQIPGFNESLKEIISSLNDIENSMRRLQENSTSSSASIVKDSSRVVKQMFDNPYSAHRYKTQFYDAYTNLSALMTSMVSMPLDIDRIVIKSVGSSYENDRPSIFLRFGFSFKRFLLAFSDDYSNISNSNGNSKGSLTIWINWGRDQAETLNSLIQDGFVQKTGINVNVKLVNASMIQAILAGSGPDCLIQMSRTEPVNLAMRGALVDLKTFDDYDEVANRFHKNAQVPYEYDGGVYAVPVTQSFFLMFMRTDILKSLGIEVPETWDDFINAASVLQRNNLQAVIPYTELANSGTVNTGVGGLTLYPTMLIQKSLSLYNEELNASTLTNVDEIQTFVDWSELYTKYKFQEITNFYNRFRIGSAPLGIAPYTVYTELKAAAPEIDGRWTVSVIPGTEDENGNINHSSAGSGAGCAITKLSKNPKNAWEFLKWWTSSEVQLKYSNTLESVLGPLGRVATANVEAFSQMDWDVEMYDSILEQYNSTVEIPEIPGGYYTARGIDQAFWNVTELGKDPTEMLTKWGEIVNTEIARKISEYSN